MIYHQIKIGSGYYTRSKPGQKAGRVAFVDPAQAQEIANYYAGEVEPITMPQILNDGHLYYIQGENNQLRLITKTLPCRVKGP